MTPRISKIVPLLLVALWTTPAVVGAATPGSADAMMETEMEWGQRTVDVYVDAQLRPDAMMLRSGETWAVVLPDRDDAWIFTRGEEGEPKVYSMPSETLTWTDPLNATTPPDGQLPTEEIPGSWADLPDGYVARAGEAAILVQRHMGPDGALEAGELWAAVPYWQRLGEAWRAEEMGKAEGEEEAWRQLGELAGEGSGIDLEVSFGTWCGDSRRSVPKLLMAADELGLAVSLMAIRRGFEEPLDFVRRNRITNVPTVIVRRHGVEIGRFVERPRTASVITDLTAILEGRPAPPPETFSDSDVLIAKGEYALRDDRGAEIGRETWSLFRTESGGTRLGSRRVDSGGRVTQVWQRWTAPSEGGRTAFVEVTRRGDAELSRTRLYRRPGDDGEDSLSSLTRGNLGGIIEQDHSIPADATVLAPSLAGFGLAWVAAGRPEQSTAPMLTVPGTGEGFAARLTESEAHQIGRDQVVLRLGESAVRLSMDARLGVPVRVERDGTTAELVSLERSEG